MSTLSAKPWLKHDADISLRMSARSHVGQVRTNNEDSYFAADVGGSQSELTRLTQVGVDGLLLGVCDGMGGAAAGEVASKLAGDTIVARMRKRGRALDDHAFARALVGSVEAANRVLAKHGKEQLACRGMGTTCTVAAIRHQHLFVGQVGDSRAYLLRDGVLVQLTKDQSLSEQLIELGYVQPGEDHPASNVILQAVGTADTLCVELTSVALRRGDRLLLCSDGLWGMLSDDKLCGVLSSAIDPEQCCETLVALANAAGGRDNITALVCALDGPGLPAPVPGESVVVLPYTLAAGEPHAGARLAALADAAAKLHDADVRAALPRPAMHRALPWALLMLLLGLGSYWLAKPAAPAPATTEQTRQVVPTSPVLAPAPTPPSVTPPVLPAERAEAPFEEPPAPTPVIAATPTPVIAATPTPVIAATPAPRRASNVQPGQARAPRVRPSGAPGTAPTGNDSWPVPTGSVASDPFR